MITHATVSDSKAVFHQEFPFVIPPLYRKLTDELLVELHLLSHQKTFSPDKLFAVGLTTVVSMFTEGYDPKDHVKGLFEALCKSNGFDSAEIRQSSEEVLSKTTKLSIAQFKDDIIQGAENNELIQICLDTKNKYYSRLTAIGIFSLLESIDSSEEEELAQDKQTILKAFINRLGFSDERAEKDISLLKGNLDKMKKAMEILNESQKAS